MRTTKPTQTVFQQYWWTNTRNQCRWWSMYSWKNKLKSGLVARCCVVGGGIVILLLLWKYKAQLSGLRAILEHFAVNLQNTRRNRTPALTRGEQSQLGQKICFPFFSCLARFLLKIFRFKCVSHITLLSLFLFRFFGWQIKELRRFLEVHFSDQNFTWRGRNWTSRVWDWTMPFEVTLTHNIAENFFLVICFVNRVCTENKIFYNYMIKIKIFPFN